MLIFFARRGGDRTSITGALALYGFGLPFLLWPPVEWPNWIVAALIALDLLTYAVFLRAGRRRGVSLSRGRAR